MMEIDNYIQKRWSPRAFADKNIEKDVLEKIFIAAGKAPSCFNEQPWRYIIGQKESKSYDKLLSCLGEWNQSWAKTAPVLAIGIAKTEFSKNGNPNHHALHDLGAASAHLTIQAFEHKIFVHQMAGFDADKAKEIFSIPEGYKAVTAISMGYIGDKDQLPEDIAKQENGPSTRKDLAETIYSENWNNKAF